MGEEKQPEADTRDVGPANDDGSWVHYETSGGFVVASDEVEGEYIKIDEPEDVIP